MLSLSWGYLLRMLPQFRGRGRAAQLWQRHRHPGEVLYAALPFGGLLPCDLSRPYEASIWLGYEETRELALLGALLSPGDIFIDCGANIGLWTICAGRLVAPYGLVFAFEPNPIARRGLEQAVSLNQLESVVTVDGAVLSDASGTVGFCCSAISTLSHVATGLNDNACESAATTLDIALAGLQVRGMKLDVEGHEMSVLRGALNTIRKSHPWMVIEFNAGLVGSPILGDWPVHRLLRAFGYLAFPCRRSAIASTPAALRDDFDATSVFKPGTNYCNLLYRPTATGPS